VSATAQQVLEPSMKVTIESSLNQWIVDMGRLRQSLASLLRASGNGYVSTPLLEIGAHRVVLLPSGLSSSLHSFLCHHDWSLRKHY
jgi:hypothetical protein